jgi:hypothetical protein
MDQDPAMNAIARVIQRSHVGISDPRCPIASFMFLKERKKAFHKESDSINKPK